MLVTLRDRRVDKFVHSSHLCINVSINVGEVTLYIQVISNRASKVIRD